MLIVNNEELKDAKIDRIISMEVLVDTGKDIRRAKLTQLNTCDIFMTKDDILVIAIKDALMKDCSE